jgi:hypothetical protein
MNNIKPQIIWEKWVDPFGKDSEETKWNNYDDDDEPEDEELEEHLNKHQPNPVKVIATPLGLIPYNEHTASSKIFNFWIGHTNFNISKNIKSIIEESEGVEILDIFTRYRFRIAIGKCFTDADVMSSIKEKIYQSLDPQYDTSQQ